MTDVSSVRTVRAASSSMEEVENTVSRLSSHKGVKAVMILSDQGEIVQSSFPPESEVEQAKILVKIKRLSSSLFQNESDEEVSFIRIRTQHHELLVAPNNDYILVVLHDPSISSVEKEV